MIKMLKSASKLVFLLIAFTACLGFYFGKLEAKDFMILAIATFSYYFTKPPTPDSSATVSTTKTVTEQPETLK